MISSMVLSEPPSSTNWVLDMRLGLMAVMPINVNQRNLLGVDLRLKKDGNSLFLIGHTGGGHIFLPPAKLLQGFQTVQTWPLPLSQSDGSSVL